MPLLRVMQPGLGDDVRPSLQKALDDVAASGGGEVVLPPGDWPYAGIVVVGDRTTLRGTGGARLIPRDPAKSAIHLRGDRPAIREVLLDGTAQRRESGGDSTGIRLLRSIGAEVDRVRVRRTAAAGFFVQGSEHFRISGCTVHDGFADGFHITGGSRFGQIIGCQSHDNGDDLFALVGYEKDGALVEHIVIAGNVGRNGDARGIAILGARFVTVQGNTIQGTRAAGLYLHQETRYVTYAPSRVSLVGNLLEDVSRDVRHAGIYIGGADGATRLADGRTVGNGIEDVVLSDTVLDGSGHDGLYVSPHATGVTGTGNRLRRVRRDAIRIEGPDAKLEVVAG